MKRILLLALALTSLFGNSRGLIVGRFRGQGPFSDSPAPGERAGSHARKDASAAANDQ